MKNRKWAWTFLYFTLLIVIMLMLSACINQNSKGTEISVEMLPIDPNEEVYNAFDQIEKLTEEYRKGKKDVPRDKKDVPKNKKDIPSTVILTVGYVRSFQPAYRTEIWNFIAGKSEDDLDRFVDEKDLKGYHKLLEQTKILIDPAGEANIDFPHMMASLNVYLKYPDSSFKTQILVDMASWMGDAIQLIGEVKQYQDDKEQLNLQISNRLGKKGLFGSGDMLADLDACNLAANYDETESLAWNMREYYKELTIDSRYQQFLNNRFPDQNKEQVIRSIKDILSQKNSLIMTMLFGQENLKQQECGPVIEAVADCLGTYWWTKANQAD